MLASSNNIKLLIRAPIASFELNRNQVLAEIASEWIDEEALTVSRFEGGSGESSSGCAVANIGCGGGLGIESTAGASYRDGLEGGILPGV